MNDGAVVIDLPEVASRPFADVAVEGAAELSVVTDTPPLEQASGDLVEWTPERAAAAVRSVGFVLHTFDPATDLEGGAELWRATEQEAEQIGAPLARILARYEPTRRLAGVVDEAELATAVFDYTKRNVRLRGRVMMAARDRGELPRGEAD